MCVYSSLYHQCICCISVLLMYYSHTMYARHTQDNTVILKEPDGAILKTPSRCSISPNGDYLAIADITQDEAFLFDMKTGQCIKHFKHQDSYTDSLALKKIRDYRRGYSYQAVTTYVDPSGRGYKTEESRRQFFKTSFTNVSFHGDTLYLLGELNGYTYKSDADKKYSHAVPSFFQYIPKTEALTFLPFNYKEGWYDSLVAKGIGYSVNQYGSTLIYKNSITFITCINDFINKKIHTMDTVFLFGTVDIASGDISPFFNAPTLFKQYGLPYNSLGSTLSQSANNTLMAYCSADSIILNRTKNVTLTLPDVYRFNKLYFETAPRLYANRSYDSLSLIPIAQIRAVGEMSNEITHAVVSFATTANTEWALYTFLPSQSTPQKRLVKDIVPNAGSIRDVTLNTKKNQLIVVHFKGDDWYASTINL